MKEALDEFEIWLACFVFVDEDERTIERLTRAQRQIEVSEMMRKVEADEIENQVEQFWVTNPFEGIQKPISHSTKNKSSTRIQTNRESKSRWCQKPRKQYNKIHKYIKCEIKTDSTILKIQT